MMDPELAAIRVSELLRNARVRSASDIHFGGGARPALRIDGRLIVLDDEPIPEPAIQTFLEAQLGAPALIRLAERGTADGACPTAGVAPARIHAYRQLGGVRVVVRLLAQTVPQLGGLELPAAIGGFAGAPLGLLLFTGPTGSGKTTALAALIDTINRTSERNIVTIEDPIEYIHTPIRSAIAHCEIGRDVVNYAEALRGMLRADPDVIVIGEMRDRETMAAALTAAETGHLVLATLHTNDAAQTIDRIVDAFPAEAQNQIRAQLAAVLLATFGLRLVPRRSGGGRRGAAEILIATDAVRTMIREGKTHQLRNAIVTGRSAGMQTLEHHLSELVARREIVLDEAQAVTSRPQDVRDAARGAA
jgi:twitching motility protein PilT